MPAQRSTTTRRPAARRVVAVDWTERPPYNNRYKPVSELTIDYNHVGREVARGKDVGRREPIV